MMKNIYSWLENLYGKDLYSWLAGYDYLDNPVGTNYLSLIGTVIFAVTTLICMLWYFIPHATFNKVSSWFIMLGITSVICLFIGFGWSYSLFPIMPNWVVYGLDNVVTDANGMLAPIDGALPQITQLNFWYFGFANMIISPLWFFIVSIVVGRNFSTHCKHIPF
jgi:hypothetical protein